ncbi:WD40-repeat-containing domain protein [Corynascus novoguineensis]|uniref:WD40-repeat-containing domain protein n=1 Tax=Corynascus novoguineensis TaxID=1126955 RepID=A0AAN7HQ18_9PEZI|nr:WD40-repeat-containing domain protein [Corynascus novoguineensis]
MRLLRHRSDGGFEFARNLPEDKLPKHAILSHTWLLDNDKEVTFEDLALGKLPSRKEAGAAKIRFCTDQAAKDGLEYTWVDSSRCYVYLEDVSLAAKPFDHTEHTLNPSYPWKQAFRRIRWFTRGWTLQELLASKSVEFFAAEGVRLGDKTTLEQWVHEITGIPVRALRGNDLADFTVAERLSWTENRHTTRKEDKAYCLLGIFNIFMPVIYGEEDYAFTPLDEVLSTVPIASEAAFNSFNNQHEPTCLPNTRTELLAEILQWAKGHDDKCIYWLSGMAGTGKSTVARTVARLFYEQGILGARFFFSRGGGDLSNANRLITTIARQLATTIPATKRHICEAITRQKNIAEHSFRDQWDQLIIGPLSQIHGGSSPPTIVLVADALDECESERDIRVLLRIFATARSLSKIRLRIFITSRPEIAIRHSLGKILDAEREIFVLHEISSDIVNRDLSLFFKSNFSTIREERGLDEDWPGRRIIELLVEISCGLFIWASTACRFIREGRRLTMRRIFILLNGHRSGVGPEKQLDQIYTAVIRDSVHQDYNQEEKAELYGILRDVLGSIVVLSSPLSMASLTSLLDMRLSHIKETLADLHTIFHILSQPFRPIRLHHLTFRDFLLDKDRCSDLEFSVDEKEANKQLAEGCRRLMARILKRDICGLGSPGTLFKNVDPKQLGRCIPDELQYACLYWVQHYRQSGMVLSDGDEVEAICPMGKSSEMGAIVRLYHSMLEPTVNTRQLPFVKDARRFLFTFQSIIKLAPLQVYCSALMFVPPTNQLKQHFKSQMHPWMKKIWVSPADVPKPKDEFNYVNDLAFTPGGKQIASGSNTNSLAISPDGTLIAAGADDFTVTVWDLKTRAVRYALNKAYSRWVNSVIFSPDGNVLASGSMDETVALWDVATGRELKRIDNQSSCVNTTAFSPDGFSIATGSVDQMIRLWDISGSREELCLVLDSHSGCINSVRFSPNGERLVSESDDMTVKVWDRAAGTELMSLKGHTKKIMAVTFCLDGQSIVSGSEDMTVRIWDGSNGSRHYLLASSSFDDDVRLWDVKNFTPCGRLEDFDLVDDVNSGSPGGRNTQGTDGLGSPTAIVGTTLESRARSSSVITLSFSEDGRLLASGSEDGTVKFWLQESGKSSVLEGHSARINHVGFSPYGDVFCAIVSPDGKCLASCSTDTTTKLWDAATGLGLATLKGHRDIVTGIAFSPSNWFLASCSADKTILVWDLKAYEQSAVLEGHSSRVHSVAFSPGDSELLASCFEDATIRLWRWRTGSAVVGIIKGEEPIHSISFSPNPKMVAPSSVHDTVGVWDWQTGSTKGSVETGVTVRTVSFSDDGHSSSYEILFVARDWIKRNMEDFV